MSHRTNTLRLARGNTARPFTGTALDVTLRACDRDVPEPVYLLAIRTCILQQPSCTVVGGISALAIPASRFTKLVHGGPSPIETGGGASSATQRSGGHHQTWSTGFSKPPALEGSLTQPTSCSILRAAAI